MRPKFLISFAVGFAEQWRNTFSRGDCHVQLVPSVSVFAIMLCSEGRKRREVMNAIHCKTLPF